MSSTLRAQLDQLCESIATSPDPVAALRAVITRAERAAELVHRAGTMCEFDCDLAHILNEQARVTLIRECVAARKRCIADNCGCPH